LNLVLDTADGRVVAVRRRGMRRNLIAFDGERRLTDRRFGVGGVRPDVGTDAWTVEREGCVITMRAADAQSAQVRVFQLLADLSCIRVRTAVTRVAEWEG
jgi:hypothetical protein